MHIGIQHTDGCVPHIQPEPYLLSQRDAGRTVAASDVSAAALLLEVLRENDAAVLSRWLPHAGTISEAAAVMAATVDTRHSAGALLLPTKKLKLCISASRTSFP